MSGDHEVNGAMRLFSAAFPAILVGSTGRDAELLRITRRKRAGAVAFASCLELKRTLPSRVGLDGVNRRVICPRPRRRRSVRSRFWTCRVPASGRGAHPIVRYNCSSRGSNLPPTST